MNNPCHRSTARRPGGVHARRRAGGGERGSATLELVVVTPLILLVLLLVIAVGRLTDARLKIDDAVHQAARAATLTATPGQANLAAQATARDALAQAGVDCRQATVTAQIGTLAPGSTITITITCHVDLAHTTGLALPGTQTLTATARSVVDTYATRTGP